MSTRIDSPVNHEPDTTTIGGQFNVPACSQCRGQQLNMPGEGEQTFTVPYVLDDPLLLDVYGNPQYGTPHPDRPSFILTDVSASWDEAKCITLTETFTKSGPEDGEFPPAPQYTLRSSEITQPINRNCHFWKTPPAAPIKVPNFFGKDIWLCNPVPKPEIADWAKGFITDEQMAQVVIGASPPPSDGHGEVDYFPLCHPKFGLKNFPTSGAEWCCTTYNVNQPGEADIGELFTVENPAGMSGATMGKWLYVGFDWTTRNGWEEFTRCWRFNDHFWDRHVHTPCDQTPPTDPAATWASNP